MDVDARVGPACPTPVPRAAMVHWWEQLTFLHWSYPPAVVQRLLPQGLEVDTFDGAAWVGLVPFFIRVGLPRIRPLPWASQFPETNVRTYVRSAEGVRGIWFFSLDAARLGAVLAARASYRLPYFWSQMEVDRIGDTLRYACRRRWPGPRGACSNAIVQVGERLEPRELDDLDHFLTARWALFSAPRSGLHFARAFHEPWPLHEARVHHVEDDLIRAAGLPAASGAPRALYAPSVEVRIGWPHRVQG